MMYQGNHIYCRQIDDSVPKCPDGISICNLTQRLNNKSNDKINNCRLKTVVSNCYEMVCTKTTTTFLHQPVWGCNRWSEYYLVAVRALSPISLIISGYFFLIVCSLHKQWWIEEGRRSPWATYLRRYFPGICTNGEQSSAFVYLLITLITFDNQMANPRS